MAAMTDRRDGLDWADDPLASPHQQPDKARRVRHMFDAIAPTYERINRLASMGRDARWRRVMVRLARVRPDDILLDLACGTGDVARTFAAGGDAGQHGLLELAGICGRWRRNPLPDLTEADMEQLKSFLADLARLNKGRK